jgi:hypothetical protein
MMDEKPTLRRFRRNSYGFLSLQPHIQPSSPRNGCAVVARGAARLRGVSKDGPGALVANPSRLAVKNGEHLRMTAV